MGGLGSDAREGARTATKCLQHVEACSGYSASVACSKPWMKLRAYLEGRGGDKWRAVRVESWTTGSCVGVD